MLAPEHIESLWIFRGELHDGDLMKQLHDFARAIEQAARREALDRTLEICEEELYAERAAERIREFRGKGWRVT